MDVFSKVLEAEKRINRYVRQTPLEFSEYLSRYCNCKVYLKLESEQITGSFKARGAFNKLIADKKLLENGFITASTGNHGKAVAYAAKILGLHGTVYVPENIIPTKLEAIETYGISIKKYSGTSSETEIQARKEADTNRIPFISPYNDPHIVAGQGTIGYELWEQLPSADVVFVCIGGGGMISGVAGYLKEKNSKIRIIGCEPENSCEMSVSVRNGRYTKTEHKPTLSDGSAGGIEPGSITLELCKQYVDEFVQVTEEEIRQAMQYMMEKHHKLVEGAAAVPLAAMLKKRRELENNKVIVVLSGSGIGIDAIRELVCK